MKYLIFYIFATQLFAKSSTVSIEKYSSYLEKTYGWKSLLFSLSEEKPFLSYEATGVQWNEKKIREALQKEKLHLSQELGSQATLILYCPDSHIAASLEKQCIKIRRE